MRAEGEAGETGWDHFEQILTRMRDDLPDGAVLVVDVLPTRQALEAADPTTTASYRAGRRIAALTAALGIRTVDTWSVLSDAVRRDGAERYFRQGNDIHFTPEGHRLIADWLETVLPRPQRRESIAVRRPLSARSGGNAGHWRRRGTVAPSAGRSPPARRGRAATRVV